MKIEPLITDEEIMDAVKNGELQRMSVLFDRYHKRIFNFLRHLAQDTPVAEDLTQNVFLRLLKYRHSYRSGSRFQPWVFQTARNVLADHYQTEKNKTFMDVEKIGDVPEEENDQDVREELLHRCLSKLSSEQREVLVLTRFEQLKYEEVAEMLNLTVANVKVKVHRAIARLRELYFELEKN